MLEAGITISDIFSRMTLSFALNGIVAFVYFRNYQGYGQPSQMALILILVGMAICGIIMAIGDNLALSLGLVGALSIVRFRSAVKENRDLAYMFWAIAIGLVCGSGNLQLAVIILIMIGIAVIIIEKWKLFSKVGGKYIVLLEGQADGNISILERVIPLLPKDSQIKSNNTAIKDQSEELTVVVRFSNDQELGELKQRLLKVNGINSINILSPDESVLN